jgi:hypothetical protein
LFADIEGGTCRLRVFENRVLKRIFGPKRSEVTGEWRKLHNEDFTNLYFSPNIIRVISSRRMRWTGHVARMGERCGAYRILVGKPEERDRLEDPDTDGSIILSSSVKLIGPWMFLILGTLLVGVPAGYVFDPKRYWYYE